MSNLINRILFDQFRVDAHVASGGMGAVYRVWDLKRNVPLAMKVLHADLAEDPSVFKRFQREARALKKITHPNIVSFYGLYQTEEFTFLLEQYINGPTLKQVLQKQRGQPLPVKETLIYLKALCASLGFAHAHGVVHCDVKPGNVMIDQGGKIYLTDFGVARHAESTTTTFGGAGTPAYMAPEQIRGEAVSPATDVYALGIMLFEMLTGQRPFRGGEAGTESAGPTAAERIRYGHLKLLPPDPRSIKPDIPEEMAIVILKALGKNLETRYSTTGELLSAACAAAGLAPESLPEYSSVKDDPSWFESIEGQPVVNPPANQGNAPVEGKKFTTGLWFGIPCLFVSGILILAAIIVIYSIARSTGSPRPEENPGPNQPTSITVIVGEQTPLPATPTAAVATAPEQVQPTNTIIPSSTPLPTATEPPPTATLTPGPVLGSTLVSEKDQMVLMYVPEGEFLMGADPSDRYANEDEQPQHNVYLDAFWIDQTEVTNHMYSLCVSAGACRPPQKIDAPNVADFYYGSHYYDQYPVTYVSWNDATDYCTWAGRRLPTDAEWEKAARGLTGRMYPWGNQAPNGFLANLCDASCPFESERNSSYNDNYPGVSAVGAFPQGASPYGALDMAGNVNEWVADFYAEDYYSTSPSSNPAGPMASNLYVLRGGSSEQSAWYARTSHRSGDWPSGNYPNLGFRCAVSP